MCTQLVTTSYKWDTVPEGVAILTVRLTAEEERLLIKRSRGARMKKSTFVRQLIRDDPFVTSADLVRDAERRMGDKRLRISRARGKMMPSRPPGAAYEDHWRKS
jgi:hypothetical protein